MKYFLTTLGCPRNQLDSDFIIEFLSKKAFEQVLFPSQADVCLVNTCAFIEAAKEESLEEIFSLVKQGKKVFVIGCLAQRYGKEIFEQIPEVSAVVSPDNYFELPQIFKKVALAERVLSFSNQKKFLYQPDCYDLRSDFKQNNKYYAYLKLTEGCNNRCSFCAIPNIRGELRSFKPELLLEKAKKILAANYKEVILVGQDITAYGLDWGKASLGSILKKLDSLDGDFWIRLLYLNPLRIDENFLEMIAESAKILPYFDLPYQHASKKILKKMGRSYDYETIAKQVETIRKILPESVIRTTLMVGFPGETEEDFQLLLELIKEINFDYVGVFDYSKEEGTVAAKFSGQISKKEKRERKEKLSFFADELSFLRLGRFLGKKLQVLVEAKEKTYFQGRFFAQTPEIDGEVILSGNAKVGSFAMVKLEKQEGFDFIGKVVSG